MTVQFYQLRCAQCRRLFRVTVRGQTAIQCPWCGEQRQQGDKHWLTIKARAYRTAELTELIRELP